MKRRTLFTSAAAIAVLAGAAITTSATDVLSSSAQPEPEPALVVAAGDTAAVRRGDLSSEREFRATVSFGDSWTITTAATGTITQQNPVGTTVDFGESLVRVDDKPLFLARGAMPMFRELSKVDTSARDANGKRPKLLTGPDVSQLQRFLLEGGFHAGERLEVDGTFGAVTEVAVEAWQESVGLAVTGRVDNAQLVFASEPVRIAAESRVGAAFDSIVVTSADPAVLIDTSNRDRAALPIGGEVMVALPEGTPLSGTVSSQEQTTASDGTTVWRTTVAVDGELPGSAGVATVNVTDVVASDVLFVPVGALLALAEGGFAVEVPSGATTTLVKVDVGEVLEGQAEIAGDVSEGDEVVIAT
ncbi:MAG: peptidoglycan-binding protein [Actinobacteria bacterium]|nr:peptidoglycan-binding protein [Actinomycetota bacterium]